MSSYQPDPAYRIKSLFRRFQTLRDRFEYGIDKTAAAHKILISTRDVISDAMRDLQDLQQMLYEPEHDLPPPRPAITGELPLPRAPSSTTPTPPATGNKS